LRRVFQPRQDEAQRFVNALNGLCLSDLASGGASARSFSYLGDFAPSRSNMPMSLSV